MNFWEWLNKLRKQTKPDSISWIYQCAKNNIPLDKILKVLKIT